MRKQLLSLCLLLSGSLAAAPVFTLDPPDGAISGPSGSTRGWGFTLTSDDSRWLSVVASLILTESDPSLGFYQDFIGGLGGPVNFTLPPNDPAWQLQYDEPTFEGVGAFTFDAAASLGAVNSGLLRVIVEAYAADPATCGGACLEETLVFDVPFSASVTEDPGPDVPEPASVSLTALALAATAWRLRRRQTS
ncbi:MAG: PEP-CTERM sorting domain-containing protein [Bryobacterales bacterium]|nr:PEP-CTERM sorting domain-containing protein [Bryobacterales bacterium]